MVELAVNRAGFYIKNRNSLVFIPFEDYAELQEKLDKEIKYKIPLQSRFTKKEKK